MTVKELIERLQKEDPDRVVVLSTDEEGNRFHLIHDVQAAAYCQGETGPEEMTDELREQGYGEEDLLQGEDVQKAVVLWP